MRRCYAMLVLTMLLLAGCRTEAGPIMPMVPDEVLAVTVADRVAAGQPAVVMAGPADVPDGTQATLVLQGSYGPRIVRSEFQNGLVRLPLSAALTEQAGLVTAIVTVPGYSGSAEILIEAGPPVEPVTPLVGARSIVADGDHWSMTVVVPFDAFNNPVADDTPVTIWALHPGDNLEQITREMAHLVGWARIYSGTTAGRTTIAVEIDRVPGPEGTLLEVPGPPVLFDLTANPPTLPADGRLLTTIRTSRLFDQFGNELLDGTQVSFLLKDEDGTVRRLPALTIDGSAEIPLQAPLEPSVVSITASVFGVASDPIVVAFTAATRGFAIETTIDSAAGVARLVAGPVLGNLGQYAPDGTPVLFYVIADDGTLQRAQGAVDRGYAVAEVRLADLSPGVYEVRARTGDAGGSAELVIEEVE